VGEEEGEVMVGIERRGIGRRQPFRADVSFLGEIRGWGLREDGRGRGKGGDIETWTGVKRWTCLTGRSLSLSPAGRLLGRTLWMVGDV